MLIKMQTFRRREFNNRFISVVVFIFIFIVAFLISSTSFFFRQCSRFSLISRSDEKKK